MEGDYDELLSRERAVVRVLSLRETALQAADVESIPLESIGGRTLAEPVIATVDLPAASHATMDGFAFDATDDYPLRVVGEVFPEDDPPVLDSGEAVRIATGAPLPEGTNTVLKREEAILEEDDLRGPSLDPGTYVYERGANVESGETLYESGDRLAPKDALLLCDLGIDSVAVREPLSVGLLATGTEIHEGRSSDLDSPMLAGLVESWGHVATLEGSVPDEYDRVEDRIDALAGAHDIVVTTGGTSVGRKDHVVRALDSLGDVSFHAVRIRPGKPIGVATLPDHDAVAFAVPGKPVGAHAIALAVLRPFFTGDRTLPTIEATASRSVGVGRGGFEYWIPVTLEDDGAPEAGGNARVAAANPPREAMPLGHADSSLSIYEETFDPSVLSSSTRAANADGFAIVDARDDSDARLEAGERINVVPYGALE